MTKKASELTRVSDRLHLWQLYDASVKAELFSTAIRTPGGLLIIDPIPLGEEFLQQLIDGSAVIGVFVTNANHCRATVGFSENFAAPIFAHNAACAACGFRSAHEVKDGERFAHDLRAIEIQGAAPGEMAIYQEQDGGALVMGDALINFEPYGFTFLPPKYCSNAKQMRRSLRCLLDYDFERMLFAHGTPLIRGARKKLEELLQASD